MKSASSTGSGSRQQKEKRPIPDDEPRMQVEDTLEMDTGESSIVNKYPAKNRCEVGTGGSHHARSS